MRTQQVEIPVKVRLETGKSAAKRLRSAGRIPAVIYGRGMESMPVSVDATTFTRALTETGWYSTLLQLRIGNGGDAEENTSAMVMEVQRDPVRRRLLSIDFHRVSLLEKLHTQVPVTHVGQSSGVRQGGILEHITHEIMVECLPTEIPDHLQVDVSSLEIGDAVRVGDLVAPPGVKILAPPDEIVLLVAPPVKLEEVAAATPVGAVVEEKAEPELIRERESRETE